MGFGLISQHLSKSLTLESSYRLLWNSRVHSILPHVSKSLFMESLGRVLTPFDVAPFSKLDFSERFLGIVLQSFLIPLVWTIFSSFQDFWNLHHLFWFHDSFDWVSFCRILWKSLIPGSFWSLELWHFGLSSRDFIKYSIFATCFESFRNFWLVYSV